MAAESETGTSTVPLRDGPASGRKARKIPYSHVTRTMHGADAIAYAKGYGQGHNGAESRNIHIAAVNMLPEVDGGPSFAEQMQYCWNRASPLHTTQVDRFIISFHPDELDPDNPRHCMVALDIGVAFAKENCPRAQSVVYVQSDGVGHKLHLHIVSNDVRFDDFKGVDPDTYFHEKFKYRVDEICSRYFELKKSEPAPERVTRAVRGRRVENERIQAANHAEWELAMKEDRLLGIGFRFPGCFSRRFRRASGGSRRPSRRCRGSRA